MTRINLDADTAHRISLLGAQDSDGRTLPDFDGVTWGSVGEAAPVHGRRERQRRRVVRRPEPPGHDRKPHRSLGQGGDEGIQNDSDGNLWIVEDSGGSNTAGTVARRPNSFVFRVVPAAPGDLLHGELQALQVFAADDHPITFESQAAVDNAGQVALHSYGNSFETRWVTIHDTAVDGATPFNANALAKAAATCAAGRSQLSSDAASRRSTSQASRTSSSPVRSLPIARRRT